MTGGIDRPRRISSPTGDLAAEAARCAQVIFGNELLAAFVGGSRAVGRQRNDSDIDAFVLIERGDRDKETQYAVALKTLHEANGLMFDHYGEIFDRATLESLLSFTELVDQTVPWMRSEAPCYRGNCLLSIYRKGRVVLEFLAAPKIEVLDPHGALSRLEYRAQRHLAGHPTDLPSPSAIVNLDHDTKQRLLRDLWRPGKSNSDGLDTPIGVGLRRWFGSELTQRRQYVSLDQLPDVGPGTALDCPLSRESTPQQVAYYAQCLAWPT